MQNFSRNIGINSCFFCLRYVFARAACSSPQIRRTASLPVTFPGSYGYGAFTQPQHVSTCTERSRSVRSVA